MTCGTLLEFCNEDFPIPPRLPPPPPILSYYFEDNQLNSSFYCEFCSNLEASLDPLHKQYGDGSGGAGSLFSPSSQNLTFILFIVALLSAAVGSAVTVVWRKWFRCKDGGILSKAFGGSNSPHSADISGSPDGRRRSRTASLGSGSALQNLQKRLSSSSFISRRSHHSTNITSTHHRSGAATISNNTYCECPSNMMMMMCSASAGGDGGNNMNTTGTSTTTTTTTSISPCVTAMNINPSAPTASTLSISGGNVYAELDPVSIQQPNHHPPLPAFPPPGDHLHPMAAGMMPIIMGPGSNGSSPAPHPLAIIGSTPGSNQYVLNHRRRQPAPLPPIPATVPNEPINHQLHNHDQLIPTNNAGNLIHSSCNMNGSSVLTSPNKNMVVGLNHHNVQMIAGVIPTVQNVVGDDNINQMEMNDLNDIYYSDLDCKQIQF